MTTFGLGNGIGGELARPSDPESCSRIPFVRQPSASCGFGGEDVWRDGGKRRPHLHPDGGRDVLFQTSIFERSVHSAECMRG